MMQKVYFTPAGVALKQTELYALPDPLLYQQCNQIQDHFDEWAENNFLLDNNQLAFLAAMEPNFKTMFCIQLAVAVYHRKDIVLQQVHLLDPIGDDTPTKGSKVFKYFLRLEGTHDSEVKNASQDYDFVIRVEYH